MINADKNYYNTQDCFSFSLIDYNSKICGNDFLTIKSIFFLNKINTFLTKMFHVEHFD